MIVKVKRKFGVISIVLAIIFLITGCNNHFADNIIQRPELSINPSAQTTINPNQGNTTALPSILPTENVPDEVVEAKFLNIIYTADNSGKYYGVADWQTYISDKWGIEIYIDYRIIHANVIFENDIQLNGVLYLKYPEAAAYGYNTEVLHLSNDKFAHDLSPYYNKYRWDNYIDKQYIDPLIVNGAIYAIPAYSDKIIVPRYYNAAYIDELNINIPETIPEFHEYLLKTKEMNASDTSFCPMVIWPMHTPCTADIFRAFGVYVDSKTNNARTFNPNTNSFEDGMFSEQAENSIGFIRLLQSENLLTVYDPVGMDELGVFNKNLATEYNIVYDIEKTGFSPYFKAESAYERLNGYYLTHLNGTNVCEIRSEIAFYMFPKALDNINGTMELFNRLFTDSKYFADLRFGVEGTDYFVINGLPVKEEAKIGKLLNLKQIRPIHYGEASLVPESIAIAESISDELSYESNVFNIKYTYLTNGYKLDSNQDNNIEYLFDKNLTPADAILKYREEFIRQGKLAIIDELNEKIGVVTTYNYGN